MAYTPQYTVMQQTVFVPKATTDRKKHTWTNITRNTIMCSLPVDWPKILWKPCVCVQGNRTPMYISGMGQLCGSKVYCDYHVTGWKRWTRARQIPLLSK